MGTTELARATAWLAYIDIFGFGAELLEPDLDALSARLNKLHESIEKEIPANENFHLYMLSDSIVIFCSHKERQRANALTDLVNLLVKIQTVAIKLEFVFRGVITHGKLVYGRRVCLGTPLLKAVRLEAQLGIPLVVLPETELDRAEDIFPIEPLGPLIIPTKNGLLLATPVFPAPIDEFRKHARQKFHDTARDGPDHVAKAWAELNAFVTNLPQPE